MDLTLALALGALQGLTEFLPVSSSGHLRLLGELAGVEEPQTLFDVVLHVGTLVAVLIVYRRLIGRMIGALFLLAVRRPHSRADARLALLTAVATVPTGVIGLALGPTMEGWSADVRVVGAALVVNAVVLWWLGAMTRPRPRPSDRGLAELTWRDALIVGAVQGLAIFRGLSRSGATITAGLATGLGREASAAFSFVVAVPAICGALLMEFDPSEIDSTGAEVFVAGGVVATVTGVLALRFLLRLLETGKLHRFAWYCLGLGLLAISFGR